MTRSLISDRKKTGVSFLMCFTLLLSFAASLWLFIYRGQLWSEEVSIFSLLTSKKALLGLAAMIVVSFCFAVVNGRIRIADLLFQYRYWIAGVALVLCVVFQISGSSIGIWSNYLGVQDDGVLLGVSRAIRSDEWAVNVPFVKSQAYVLSGSYSYFNDVVRAAPTDMFSVAVVAPVWHFLTIFKPFNLGYLILPFSYGLAFNWSARLICLFMVSFEFGRLITKDHRLLALMYAVLVILAPAIQWWSFQLADALIGFELAMILLQKYIQTESYKKRWLYALGIVWCAGVFLFQLYPAWQIPLFYIMIAVFAWIMISGWKTFQKSKKDLLILAAAVAAIGAIAAVYVLSSRDAIQTVMGTVYPGARSEIGGNYGIGNAFNYISNMWYPYLERSNTANLSEASQFLHFFPISILLPVAAMIRKKKADVLSICMLAAFVFLSVYIFIGFPGFLAKITLLYTSPSSRAVVLWELINILLLVRGLSLWAEQESEEPVKHRAILVLICILLAGVFAAGSVWAADGLAAGYFSTGMLAVSFLILFVTAFLMFPNGIKKTTTAAVWAVVIFSIFAGILINPVRAGIAFMDKSDTLQAMEEIEKEDSGAVWIVDNMGYPYTNLGLLEGLNTINSTNPYPDLERWHILDPEGQYEDIYNRYAHIDVILSDEDRFELLGPDHIRLYLSEEGLQKLNVDYILTNRELEGYELVRTTSLGCYIYKAK